MAARALISLFRNVNPSLLHHKDRGRPLWKEFNTIKMTKSVSPVKFGATKVLEFVPGAEILPTDKPTPQLKLNSKKKKKTDNSSDEESDWIDVSSNEENSSDILTEKTNDNDDKNNSWITESESDYDEDRGAQDNVFKISKNCKFKLNDKTIKKVNVKLTKTEKKKEKAIEKNKAKVQALEKAKLISESRIMTDSDFQAIKVYQIKQQMNEKKLYEKLFRKRTNDEILLDEEIQEKIARKEGTTHNGLPKLNDIEHFHKKIYRQTKAERLAQAATDKSERKRLKKQGEHVGRTNREMAKRKNFQMVRQKIRGKNRQRSFRDRQLSLRNYLLRQAGKKV